MSKQDLNTEEQLQLLARFAKALSHPIRLQILQFLHKQEFCFTGDLVEVLPLAQSTISQHLKELKEAGLIQGEVMPPRTRYCINQENWELAQQLFNNFFTKSQAQLNLKTLDK